MAHDKNKGIFLWLLEQERQKDRARQLKEKYCNMPMQPSNILPEESYYGKFQEEKDVQLELSESGEVNKPECLIKEKANLEKESHCLDEQQEKYNLQIKALLEKIVEEKKKKNNEKREEIKQLQARIKVLEDQFESLFVDRLSG